MKTLAMLLLLTACGDNIHPDPEDYDPIIDEASTGDDLSVNPGETDPGSTQPDAGVNPPPDASLDIGGCVTDKHTPKQEHKCQHD